MHLKPKVISILGLLTALSVILIIVSGIFETNTLWLLCLASYLVGIAIVEGGIALGGAFIVASTCLGVIFATNKLYCGTYFIMAIFIFGYELYRVSMEKRQKQITRKNVVIMQYILFNVLYVPTIVLFPHLFFQGKLSIYIIIAFIVCGQIILYVYACMYDKFIAYYCTRIRKQIGL